MCVQTALKITAWKLTVAWFAIVHGTQICSNYLINQNLKQLNSGCNTTWSKYGARCSAASSAITHFIIYPNNLRYLRIVFAGGIPADRNFFGWRGRELKHSVISIFAHFDGYLKYKVLASLSTAPRKFPHIFHILEDTRGAF